MASRRTIIALIACTVVVSPTAALACDLPDHFLKHIAFSKQQYSAQQTGNILLVSKSIQDRRIAHWLAGAGHNVDVVGDLSELREVNAVRTADVIIGYFADRAAVEAALSDAGSKAIFLPITAETTANKVFAYDVDSVILPHEDFTPERLLKKVGQSLERVRP